MKHLDCIIIGAGGAGLICAAFASQKGKKVLLIDHSKKVGEKNAWKMTEFKPNEMLAEKNIGDKTVFSTIKFFEGTLTFSNASESQELFNAIKEELNTKKASH